MAKGIGLIGNFRGKVGNMVGYNLKDSNNKQTQGVRVYQPVVKNPKTYGQAEQRAKLAPINATYRELKAIIDRGQEGKAYGNKSRLAWLSDAMKAFNGGWFDKGAAITAPALVPLTKGSLSSIGLTGQNEMNCHLEINGVESEGTPNLGVISTALLSTYPTVKNGDQITFISIYGQNGTLGVDIVSIVVDTTSTASIPDGLIWEDPDLTISHVGVVPYAGSIIVSREGDNGAHLRSTTSLKQFSQYPATPLTPAAKEAAIKSYMSAGANTDWAEESLQ